MASPEAARYGRLARMFGFAPSATEAPSTRRVWHLCFLAIALSYLVFVPYFPALNNPNENSRVYQIRAVVELGKLSVNEQIRRYGPVNDLAVREGTFYAGKAPATTFIGVPIYAATRWWTDGEPTPLAVLYALRLFGVIVPCLGFLWWFRRFARTVTLDDHLATLLTIVLALGTMFLPYALIFVNHSLTAATAFGAMMAAWRARSLALHGQRSALAFAAASGFLLSLTTALDYALFPISVLLLIYAGHKTRWLSWSAGCLVLGAALPAGATAAYHQACWGSPVKTSLGFLANPSFAEQHSQGVFGVIGPTMDTVTAVLLSPSKGLIYFSPVFALALPLVLLAPFGRRLRAEAWLSAAIVVWMLTYNVSLINWHAGWTVGPRYVTVITPFVVFSAGLLLGRLRGRLRRGTCALFAGLSLASIAATASASVLFPHLNPAFDNPLFENIWPLWRDAITPLSVGGELAELRGRAAQLPMLVVLGASAVAVLLLGAARFGRWTARSLRTAVAVGVSGGVLWLASAPRTADTELVKRANAWIRSDVWHPPLPRR